VRDGAGRHRGQTRQIPEPGASVNKDAAGGDVGEGANCVDKVFAPRCHILRRVERGVGGRNFDVQYQNLAVAQHAHGVDKVLGLRLGVLARVAKVISAPEVSNQPLNSRWMRARRRKRGAPETDAHVSHALPIGGKRLAREGHTLGRFCERKRSACCFHSGPVYTALIIRHVRAPSV
jgi:hypothetical protein